MHIYIRSDAFDAKNPSRPRTPHRQRLRVQHFVECQQIPPTLGGGGGGNVRVHHEGGSHIAPHKTIQSIWRDQGNTVGMQGLERAEGAGDSQGHKALGIHRPCLGPVRTQRGEFSSFTLGQQGFEIHPRDGFHKNRKSSKTHSFIWMGSYKETSHVYPGRTGTPRASPRTPYAPWRLVATTTPDFGLHVR